jgi:hypothetical protein
LVLQTSGESLRLHVAQAVSDSTIITQIHFFIKPAREDMRPILADIDPAFQGMGAAVDWVGLCHQAAQRTPRK